MKERMVIYDEDGTALLFRTPLGQVREHAEQWFGHLLASGADMIIYDCASPDIVYLKDCPHGELLGARFVRFEGHHGIWHARTALMELIEQGTDVLDVASRIAHDRGKLVLAEMRMSDVHHYHGGIGNPLYPQFVWDHPELCIQKSDGTPDIVLDYSYPEVRDRRLAVLRDIAENYDVDGFDLNWMRWCRHFAKGRQHEKAHMLTEFLHDVRKMLDEVARERGRPRFLLSHQVAAGVDECLDIGCDVRAWVHEGLADLLLPMDFIHADYGIRTEEFAEIVAGTDCGIYPTIQSSMIHLKSGSHTPTYTMSVAKYRAAISNLYAWGANGVSCFNFCCWGFDPRFADSMVQTFGLMRSPEKLSLGARHYHYVPIWRDHSGGVAPTGKHNAQILQFRTDDMGRRLEYRFRMADGRDAQKLLGSLVVRIFGGTVYDTFELDVNGQAISASDIVVEDRGIIQAHGFAAYPPGINLIVGLEDCPPFAGDNCLGIKWRSGTPELVGAPTMEVLEVMVQAPMGID